jgi:response regulator RpfG family c-di-GMP phosphodiesterase
MDKRQDDIQPLRILIVEDSSERLEYFRGLYTGHTVPSADSCKDALRLYTDNEFDLIHLDFDLVSETSEAFACHLAKHADCGLVVIHSDNPVGARLLHEVVPSSIVVTIARLRETGPALSFLKQILASAPSLSDVEEALKAI